jgi:hypothetical protein
LIEHLHITQNVYECRRYQKEHRSPGLGKAPMSTVETTSTHMSDNCPAGDYKDPNTAPTTRGHTERYNFAHHVLIFPFRILTTGGSDAARIGRLVNEYECGLNPQFRALGRVLEPNRAQARAILAVDPAHVGSHRAHADARSPQPWSVDVPHIWMRIPHACLRQVRLGPGCAPAFDSHKDAQYHHFRSREPGRTAWPLPPGQPPRASAGPPSG